MDRFQQVLPMPLPVLHPFPAEATGTETKYASFLGQ